MIPRISGENYQSLVAISLYLSHGHGQTRLSRFDADFVGRPRIIILQTDAICFFVDAGFMIPDMASARGFCGIKRFPKVQNMCVRCIPFEYGSRNRLRSVFIRFLGVPRF